MDSLHCSGQSKQNNLFGISGLEHFDSGGCTIFLRQRSQFFKGLVQRIVKSTSIHLNLYHGVLIQELPQRITVRICRSLGSDAQKGLFGVSPRPFHCIHGVVFRQVIVISCLVTTIRSCLSCLSFCKSIHLKSVNTIRLDHSAVHSIPSVGIRRDKTVSCAKTMYHQRQTDTKPNSKQSAATFHCSSIRRYGSNALTK